MKFCMSCGTPLGEGARFCGECGTALNAAETVATAHGAASEPSAPAPTGVAGPPPSTPQAGPASPPPPHTQASASASGPRPSSLADISAQLPAEPAVLARAGLALLLVVAALAKPWEVSGSGFLGYDSDAAASNGWVLVSLILVALAAVLGVATPHLSGAGYREQARVLQTLLVAPAILAVVIGSVRALGESTVAGPSVALALTAAILALQVRGDAGEADYWRIGAMALLCVGIALSLWGLQDLAGFDGLFVMIFLVSLIWLPALTIWFATGLKEHRPAEWAALMVTGGGLLVGMLTADGGLTGGYVVGLVFILGGATAAAAPGVASLMRMPADPAQRWLTWAAGVMVLWITASAVMTLLGLLGLIASAQYGGGSGEMVWLTVWGLASTAVAVLARKQLLEEPTKGRRLTVILAGAAIVLFVISLAATDIGTDATTLLSGLAVPVSLVLMLTVPPSVNRRFGSVFATGSANPS